MRSPLRSVVLSLLVLSSGCPSVEPKDKDDGDNEPFVQTTPPPLPGGGEEDFSGSITCDAPQSILFDGEASEVIELQAGFVEASDSAFGATPSVTLRFAGEDISRDGNPVGVSGAVYVDEPLEGSFLVNLLETGTYELFFTVAECETVDFEATLTRIRVPSDNRDQASAAFIEDGRAVASVLGCEEERWFEIEVDDGDSIRMDLGGVSIVEDENGVFRAGSAALDLLDENGDNVMASGNPVSVSHDIDGTLDETTLEFSFETGGTYFLKSYYWNGCTIGDIYARYHVL